MAAVLVGDESLLAQCGELLLQRGHQISLVVTQSPAIFEWARTSGVVAASWDERLPDLLKALDFDWLFSIANLRILPDEILRCARKGAVNFHDGPLPRYAGLNTPSWAILEDAPAHGVTWHAVTGGVDTGDILAERSFAIDADETVLTINAKCFEAGMASFADLVSDIEASNLTPRPQRREDRVLYRKNARPPAAGLLDFRRSAAELSRLCRALDFGARYANPLVTPKVETRKGPFVVTRLAIEGEAGGRGAGTVVSVDADGIVVASADRLVRIEGEALDGSERLGAVVAPHEVLPLPAADEIVGIDAIVGRVVAHEADWVSALAAVTDVDGDWAGGSTGSSETLSVKLPVGVSPDFARCVIPAFLARLHAKTRFSVAYSNGELRRLHETSRGLVALSVPVTFDCEFDDTAGQTRARIESSYVAAHGKVGFLSDIYLRHPGLARPRLAIGIVETREPASDAATIDGCAITFAIDPNGWARAICDGDRISLAAARELIGRLEIFAEAFSDPERRIGTMPIASDEEMQPLLGAFNDTAGPYDRELCVHHLIERQAASTPQATAVAFLDRSMTYAQLNRAASSVAAALIERGAGPDVPIGLHVRRSIELVVGALAIMKAGAAYVPLDPDFPEDRLALMVEDSAARIVLTEKDLAPITRAEGVLSLDIAGLIQADRAMAATPAVRPDNLAYIIYTSGSTGRPKGVMIEHRNVVNFFAGMDERVPVLGDGQPVWLAVTSLSFDISVLELFWTLSRGFKVVIHASEVHRAHRRAAMPAAHAPSAGRPVDFGLFYWGNDDGAGPAKYRMLLEGAKFADAHGFQAIWTPERHFHAFGGPYPNPSVTGAAVAAVTSNLQIRAGSCVLPLHHPLRVAEEWAVVDNISNGRVGLALASGWMPEDFVLRPENAPPANKAALFRDIETLRRLWRGEPVPFSHGGADVPVVTQPRPVQAELPIWLTTAGNPASYREAAQIGANVLTHLLGQSIEELADKIAVYREALAQAGRDPADFKVTLMLHTLLGEDREEVRELAREPMKDYLRSAAALIKQYAWAFPAFKKPAGASNAMEIDLRDLAEDEMDAILEFAFLRYFEDSGLFGTVEDCQSRIRQLTAIGVDEIACLIDFGVSTEIVLSRLEALAQLVAECRLEQPAEAAGFAAEVARHGVTHMQCTPSMVRMFLADEDNREAIGRIRHLMIGGEPLAGSLLAELRSTTDATIENMYGPTETTIWSSTVTAEPTEGVVPIGRPILNTQFYVLDRLGNPVPAGVAGELQIGGDGVARGYLGRPDLTLERFVKNPFGDGRIYRTGDLVAFERDGRTLRFLGRSDHQVKVRGYRIELGEIEARIQAFPGVSEAVVVTHEPTPGDTRIVAYLRVAAPVDHALLRAHVAQSLPEYMVPSRFVELDRFPLTPNAKVDRSRLPQIEAEDRAAPVVEQIHLAPKDHRERAIAEAFARVLGVERVGLADNFFALGGHSLLAVQVHRDLKASVAPELTITDLFRFPTVGALAAHLANRTSSNERLNLVADRAAARRARMQQGVGVRA